MSRQKLIEDTLLVTDINKDGKVFEKVSRIHGSSDWFQFELDVNTDLYPMQKGQKYSLVLASSLTPDGAEEFDLFRNQSAGSAPSLLDQFDYVMHGKIFEDKLSEESDAEGRAQQMLTVFVSFGGLLMSIKGKNKDLKDLEMDSRIYLLLKYIG